MKLPVYVINLDRRKDRWAAISAELIRLGIEHQRIAAIDADDPEFVREFNNPYTNSGAQACAQSHYKALKKFLATDRPSALILEDDVEISADVPSYLASFEWSYPRNGLIKLEVCHEGKPIRQGPVQGKTPCGRSIREVCKWRDGAGGYLISRTAAAIVLGSRIRQVGGRREIAPLPIDRLLFNVRRSSTARMLRPLQVNPGMVRQKLEEFGSDLSYGSGSIPPSNNYGLRFLDELRRLPYRFRTRWLRITKNSKEVPIYYVDKNNP